MRYIKSVPVLAVQTLSQNADTKPHKLSYNETSLEAVSEGKYKKQIAETQDVGKMDTVLSGL